MIVKNMPDGLILMIRLLGLRSPQLIKIQNYYSVDELFELVSVVTFSPFLYNTHITDLSFTE